MNDYCSYRDKLIHIERNIAVAWLTKQISVWHSSPHSVCTIRRNTWRDCGYQGKGLCTFTMMFPEAILNKSVRCHILVSFPVPVTKYPVKKQINSERFYSAQNYSPTWWKGHKIRSLEQLVSLQPQECRDTIASLCLASSLHFIQWTLPCVWFHPQLRWVFPHWYNPFWEFP